MDKDDWGGPGKPLQHVSAFAVLLLVLFGVPFILAQAGVPFGWMLPATGAAWLLCCPALQRLRLIG